RDLLCQSQGSRFSSSRTGCLSKESASLRGRMLARRMESSSKYYKELPCVIAKSLRSEEHTSELQSRFDLVCRLLLEKKKLQVKGALEQPAHLDLLLLEQALQVV